MAVAGPMGPRSGGKGGDWWDGTGWMQPCGDEPGMDIFHMGWR